jgi:nucleotide-binding universal stress UspA family protein
LVPISSEFSFEQIVQRAGMLSHAFNSAVMVVYIIETKTLKTMGDVAETMLTDQQLKEMGQDIVSSATDIAKQIIFERVKPVLPNCEIAVAVGEFSEEIRRAAEKWQATCVVTGYERYCTLRYRLLEDLNLPLWVEQHPSTNPIVLGVCSNLAPNKRVPDLTIELAANLNAIPHLLYVVDIEELVEMDEQGEKHQSTTANLTETGQMFLRSYRDHIHGHFSVGVLEDNIVRYTTKLNPDVVIIGHEMKRKKFLCHELKRDIVTRMQHSLLFLN